MLKELQQQVIIIIFILILEGKGMINNYISRVENFNKSMCDFIVPWVDLICKWKPLKDSSGLLKAGNNATDKAQKFEHFGGCVGKIVETIGSGPGK